MKILLVHHAPVPGGGSISLLDIASMLSEEHEVAICAPASPVWLQEQAETLGIEFVAASVPFPVYYHYNGTASGMVRLLVLARGLATYLAHRAAWRRLIQSLDADLVVLNSAVLCLFGPIVRAAQSRCVCLVRETFPPPSASPLTRMLYRILDRYCSRVVFLSEYDRRQARISERRTAVVHDCIRPGLLRRVDRAAACASLGVPSTTFNVLFTGGGSELKGFDVALEAMTRFDGDGARLLVAGLDQAGAEMVGQVRLRRCILDPRNAAFRLRVRRLLQYERVRKRVVYLGTLTDMSPAFSAADVVIFPSTLPHQARPIYEAGFYDLPIVIADFPHTGEFVRAGYNGLVHDPGNAVMLAARLEQLLAGVQLRHDLGVKNHLKYESERSFLAMKRELVALVDDAIAAQ